jgi:hypothetical protein
VTFLRIVIPLYLFGLSMIFSEKPVPTFPDHALARSQIRIDAIAAHLVRPHRLDGDPFEVVEFIAHDSMIRFGA